MSTEAAEPPCAVLKNGAIQYRFLGTFRGADLPGLRTRITLTRAYHLAFDVPPEQEQAQAEERALAAQEGREPRNVLDPSCVDSHALGAVYAACLGLVWPKAAGIPTLRQHRHDPVDFGDAFVEWLIGQRIGKGADVLQEIGKVGKALFDIYRASSNALLSEAQEEAGFTETPSGDSGST